MAYCIFPFVTQYTWTVDCSGNDRYRAGCSAGGNIEFPESGRPLCSAKLGDLMGNGMSAVLGGAWWTIVFPGLMIVTTVLCINLVGDGLRDMISPRQRDGC